MSKYTLRRLPHQPASKSLYQYQGERCSRCWSASTPSTFLPKRGKVFTTKQTHLISCKELPPLVSNNSIC